MRAISTVLGNRPGRAQAAAAPREHLTIVTRRRLEFNDLTADVEAWVAAQAIPSGSVTIRSMHTTAAVFLGEWQDALLEDYRRLLERLVPERARWRHNDPRFSDCDRKNAAAHLRALLLGSSVTLWFSDGRLDRGQWQSIIFAELDGPRTRQVAIDAWQKRPDYDGIQE